jgi:hypothetical protein
MGLWEQLGPVLGIDPSSSSAHLCATRPFDHERMSAARELPVDDIQSEDVVLRFVLAVKGMKMRWGMIVPIHPNEDAEEFAYGRHVGVLRLKQPTFG